MGQLFMLRCLDIGGIGFTKERAVWSIPGTYPTCRILRFSLYQKRIGAPHLSEGRTEILNACLPPFPSPAPPHCKSNIRLLVKELH